MAVSHTNDSRAAKLQMQLTKAEESNLRRQDVLDEMTRRLDTEQSLAADLHERLTQAEKSMDTHETQTSKVVEEFLLLQQRLSEVQADRDESKPLAQLAQAQKMIKAQEDEILSLQA